MPSGGPEHYHPSLDTLPSSLFDPNEFTTQGFVGDYRNYAQMAVIIWIVEAAQQRKPLGMSLKDELRKVRTYSEYLAERVDEFNRFASRRKKRQAKRLEVLRLLVTDTPGANTLDEFAAQLRLLGQAEIDENQLFEPAIRILADMEGVMAGEERKDRILERFGLSKP